MIIACNRRRCFTNTVEVIRISYRAIVRCALCSHTGLGGAGFAGGYFSDCHETSCKKTIVRKMYILLKNTAQKAQLRTIVCKPQIKQTSHSHVRMIVPHKTGESCWIAEKIEALSRTNCSATDEGYFTFIMSLRSLILNNL